MRFEEVFGLLALRRDRGLLIYRGHAVQSPGRAQERHDPSDSLVVRHSASGDGRPFLGHKNCNLVDAFHGSRTVGRIHDSQAL